MTIPIKIIKKQEFKRKQGLDQEKVWDSIAIPWGIYRVKKILIVEEFLRGKKGRVIDLGCGSGRNMIPSKDIEYYGVDFSKEQLKHARKYIKKEKVKAKLFNKKADDLGIFNDQMFDYGLFIASLHCLEGREERKRALEEFYRVLKKNSEALVSVWNSDDKRFDCVGNQGDIYMSWKENGIDYMRYYYLFSKKEFLNLLEGVDFEILEFYKPREKDRFSRKNWIVRIRKQ